jgi:hypothetical protein
VWLLRARFAFSVARSVAGLASMQSVPTRGRSPPQLILAAVEGQLGLLNAQRRAQFWQCGRVPLRGTHPDRAGLLNGD